VGLGLGNWFLKGCLRGKPATNSLCCYHLEPVRLVLQENSASTPETERQQMAGPHKITVTVVVSGARISVTENANQKVSHLIREALKEAGIPHPKVEDWTLRFGDGGSAINPDLRIDEAGIANGATLFLDPDEGGGGEVAVAPGHGPGDEHPPAPPVLVDPAVSAAKLERQLDDWKSNADQYAERGWQILDQSGLEVDIAFATRLPVGPMNDLVAIPLAVRFDFHNYDVWAPSVRIIDPLNRCWLQIPRVRAIDFKSSTVAGAPLDLFVHGHPESGHVFLCKAGTREYHTHFEHSGNDWLLYRDQGYGTLARLCDLLWRTAVRSITGLNFVGQRVEVAGIGPSNFGIEVRQENSDELRANLAPQVQASQEIPIAQAPPEILAMLPPEIQAQLPPELRPAPPEGQ
jgi:hypothetical protein